MARDLKGVLLETLAIGGMGLLMFALCFGLIVALCPFSIRKEIEHDQNIALAILIASVVVGIAIIVGAVVRG